MFDFVRDTSVQKLVKKTLHGCDDGELFVEDSLNESFLFDDNVLKNSSFSKSKGFGLRAMNNELTMPRKRASELIMAITASNAISYHLYIKFKFAYR